MSADSTDVATLQAQITQLQATLAALTARLEEAPLGAPSRPERSRRDLLKLAGGLAVGAAGGVLTSATSATAANGDPLAVGSQATPTAGTVAISGIDYTSSGGAKGSYPEVRAWLAQVLPHFPMSQHSVSNFEIEVSGDRAKSRVYFYNPMARPKDDGVTLFFIGGYYVDELTRTPAGWRITQRIEQQAWLDVRS